MDTLYAPTVGWELPVALHKATTATPTLPRNDSTASSQSGTHGTCTPPRSDEDEPASGTSRRSPAGGSGAPVSLPMGPTMSPTMSPVSVASHCPGPPLDLLGPSVGNGALLSGFLTQLKLEQFAQALSVEGYDSSRTWWMRTKTR